MNGESKAATGVPRKAGKLNEKRSFWDLAHGLFYCNIENLDLFGFELRQDEMTAITALDRVEKHNWY